MGILIKAEFGRVELFFPASNEHRQYALKSAPLRRVQFSEGDRIKTHDGSNLVVDSVEEQKGLFIYHTAERAVTEAELADTISFSKPEDRLLGGQVDDLHTFDLRVEALFRRTALRQSPVRGYVGGRVDLIPHQMFIAGEVASRLAPRVLLADEVGLGKTIEAGLILHRLHLTGRAERVLILVPEPLIHQWFVELLRRFNLLFSIFDEDRCESIEMHDQEANPFLDSQLVLCSVPFLSENRERAAQALAAGWDLLIVDEAHHLQWSPDLVSPQYRLVEALARQTSGVLLLTATPQQLGPEGHFARLRLLDPSRYADLAQFLEESAHYEEVAQAVDRSLSGEPLRAADETLFAGKSERIGRHLAELKAGDTAARSRVAAELLDAFGTGRVMFRNTRAALSGFPERKATLVPLEAGPGSDPQLAQIKWLASLLKELPEEKVLLICRTRALAEQIHENLQREINVNAALFHEGLTLLQRDRNAAYFSENDGARILICSEIGSEGRNFQFAHHLVLHDLPVDPELLEQRIGRLDRIGQTATIQIHVPHFPGTDSEVYARWYHEGLNAFEKNLHGAAEIAHTLEPELAALHKRFDTAALDAFLQHSRELRSRVARKLERGHDRLLELNSCRPAEAEKVIAQIRASDADTGFEEFFIRLLDHFGVHVEELGLRSYLFLPGHMVAEAFPSLPAEGMSVTFQRTRALSREDLGFMSGDHPLVRGALDLLLGSEAGNAAFAVWKRPGPEAVLLEIYAVIECIAPPALHIDRFLPTTPVRVVVDHLLVDRTDDAALASATLEKGDVFRLLDRPTMKKKHFPAMLEKAQTLAAEKMQRVVEAAETAVVSQLQSEIERLEDLRRINDHVRPEEITAAREQKAALHEALGAARLRLDALRLIVQGAG